MLPRAATVPYRRPVRCVGICGQSDGVARVAAGPAPSLPDGRVARHAAAQPGPRDRPLRGLRWEATGSFVQVEKNYGGGQATGLPLWGRKVRALAFAMRWAVTVLMTKARDSSWCSSP